MGDEKSKTGGLRGFLRRFLYVLKATGIAILFAAGVTLSLLFTGVRSQQPYDVKVGDIAAEDIRAPHSIVYVSEIETESARQAAAFGVADVFDAPDPRIGRAQVRKLGAREWEWALLCDMSLSGCYVETPAPSSAGSRLEINLTIAGVQFTVLGDVTACHPRVGMGVEFRELGDLNLQRLRQVVEILSETQTRL